MDLALNLTFRAGGAYAFFDCIGFVDSGCLHSVRFLQRSVGKITIINCKQLD
jgi:lysozyme family protein